MPAPRPAVRTVAWAAGALLWVPAGLVLTVAARGLPPPGPDLGIVLANLAVAAPAGLPLALAARRACRRGLRWSLAAALVILAPLTVGAALVGGLLGPAGIYAYAVAASIPLWILPWARDVARRTLRGRNGA